MIGIALMVIIGVPLLGSVIVAKQANKDSRKRQ